jgi:Ser/Thr protein kinase RdoA (MazF antagonist)
MSEQQAVPSLGALTTRARQALDHWGLSDQTPELLKYRENAVFRVRLSNGAPAALRLHRPGYRDEHALASELLWMARRDGHVPAITLTNTVRLRRLRRLLLRRDQAAERASSCRWPRPVLPASPRAGKPAELHVASDAWTPPASFTRPSWDLDGLLGERPLWGRFWDCAGLLPDESRRLSLLRDRLRRQVSALQSCGLDYGLIHADLVRENVLLDGERIEMIDFDDGGYGWRMFDIATALFKNREEPEFPRMKAALIEGYRTVRPLSESDLDRLPLFMVLRSVTYIGWAGDRTGLPDTGERLRRYVDDTLSLADALPDL